MTNDSVIHDWKGSSKVQLKGGKPDSVKTSSMFSRPQIVKLQRTMGVSGIIICIVLAVFGASTNSLGTPYKFEMTFETRNLSLMIIAF